MHPILHEINQGETGRTEPRMSKIFYDWAEQQIKCILANFKKQQFFIGENMNLRGMVALLDYHEGGVTQYITFFKNNLEMEKMFTNLAIWIYHLSS